MKVRLDRIFKQFWFFPQYLEEAISWLDYEQSLPLSEVCRTSQKRLWKEKKIDALNFGC